MARSLTRHATRDLTHLGFVLAPGAVRGRWRARLVMLCAGVLLGVGACRWGEIAQWAGVRHATSIAAVANAASAVPAGPSPQQVQLEQSQLALKVAEGRSEELERQIASLVKQLRETQEELTFFRKAREGRSSR